MRKKLDFIGIRPRVSNAKYEHIKKETIKLIDSGVKKLKESRAMISE